MWRGEEKNSEENWPWLLLTTLSLVNSHYQTAYKLCKMLTCFNGLSVRYWRPPCHVQIQTQDTWAHTALVKVSWRDEIWLLNASIHPWSVVVILCSAMTCQWWGMLPVLQKAPVNNKMIHQTLFRLGNDRAVGGSDLIVINEPVLRTSPTVTVALPVPTTSCCIAQAHSNTHISTHALHILIIVCWNDQVSSSALVLLSGWEQQCSVDPFRQSSTIPHEKVRQTVPAIKNKKQKHTHQTKQDAHCAPQSRKNPDRLRVTDWRSCVLLINSSRGAAHIVPHPLQQLLRLKSCPASNYDCIPENRQGNKMPVML